MDGAVERNVDLIADSAAYVESTEYRKLIADDHGVVRNPRGAITPFKLRDGHHVALLYYNNGQTEKVSGSFIFCCTPHSPILATSIWSKESLIVLASIWCVNPCSSGLDLQELKKIQP